MAVAPKRAPKIHATHIVWSLVDNRWRAVDRYPQPAKPSVELAGQHAADSATARQSYARGHGRPGARFVALLAGRVPCRWPDVDPMGLADPIYCGKASAPSEEICPYHLDPKGEPKS